MSHQRLVRGVLRPRRETEEPRPDTGVAPEAERATAVGLISFALDVPTGVGIPLARVASDGPSGEGMHSAPLNSKCATGRSARAAAPKGR